MVVKRIFLLAGILMLLVVISSWFIFPAWQTDPKALILLITGASIGVISIIRNVLGIIKDTQEINKSNPAKDQSKSTTIQQSQINSKDASQSYTGPITNSSQKQVGSSEAKQSINITKE